MVGTKLGPAVPPLGQKLFLFWGKDFEFKTLSDTWIFDCEENEWIQVVNLIGQAKRAPHWAVQSRFRVILYISVYVSVCMSTIVYGKPIQNNCMPKCVGRITWSKHAHAQSQFCEFETKCHLESLILPSSDRLKLTCDTRIIHFYYTLGQL